MPAAVEVPGAHAHFDPGAPAMPAGSPRTRAGRLKSRPNLAEARREVDDLDRAAAVVVEARSIIVLGRYSCLARTRCPLPDAHEAEGVVAVAPAQQ
ncbi:MAG: hypothetical protein IPH30_07295 [Betaproteobacteria bacterium]|nr:hypothetical protein [Betaproteobacteria bacterium]